MVIVVFGIYAGATGKGPVAISVRSWPDSVDLAHRGRIRRGDGGFAVFRGCVEQHYLCGRRGGKPQAQPAAFDVGLGTGSVVVDLLLINVVYVYILPIDQIQNAEQDRVGTLLMSTIAATGACTLWRRSLWWPRSAASTALFWRGSRVYYAMVKDGLFKTRRQAEPKPRTRQFAADAVVYESCVLVFSGSYVQLMTLLDFCRVAVLYPYRGRRHRVAHQTARIAAALPKPSAIRIARFVCVVGRGCRSLLWLKFDNTWPGLVLVLAGCACTTYLKRRTRINNKKTSVISGVKQE